MPARPDPRGRRASGVLILLSLCAGADAGTLVNGGFDAGLSGWSSSGARTSADQGFALLVADAPATDDSVCAIPPDTVGVDFDRCIFQSVDLPDAPGATLSFDFAYTTAANGLGNAFAALLLAPDHARQVDLLVVDESGPRLDPSGAGLDGGIEAMASDDIAAAFDPLDTSYTGRVSVALTEAVAGDAWFLVFELLDPLFPALTRVAVDDVSIDAAGPVPEPVPVGPFATFMTMALLYRAHRRWR